MVGVALCRLPTQHCDRCGDEYLDEELEPLRDGEHELYCASCRDRIAEKLYEDSCEDYYGGD